MEPSEIEPQNNYTPINNDKAWYRKRRAWAYVAAVLVVAGVLFTVFMFVNNSGPKHIVRSTSTPRNSIASTNSSQSTSAGSMSTMNVEYNNGGYGVYSAAALSSSTIGAADVTLDWSKVEPTQDNFNWQPLDTELSAWNNAHKKVVLIIRYAAESGNTHATGCSATATPLPDWVRSQIPSFCDSDRGVIIPDYFNTNFQSLLKSYIQAIANHIAASNQTAAIYFVRPGLGLGGEGFPLPGCSGSCNQADYQTDSQQLVSWGYTPQNWETWQEQMLQTVQNDFLSTKVVYGINEMFTPADNTLNTNPATHQQVQMDVAYYAAAHNMGVGQQGLVASYNTDYANINEIMAYINDHYPKTFIQFAAWGPLAQTPPCNNNPTSSCVVNLAQEDIKTIESYHASSMDWWSQDDTNPTLQPTFQQWLSYKPY